MNIGGYSATGPRKVNEDSLFFRDFSNVNSFSNGISCFAMVSDGMGGYLSGDVASQLAVAEAQNYIEQILEMARHNEIDLDPVVALEEIARNANEAIVAESKRRGYASMGATYVAMFANASHVWIGHVGDSRAYLIRNGEAIQITEDHSRVGRMLSQGVITESEAQNHPERNKIERALGFSNPTPESNDVEFGPNDAILLCSDGVSTVLKSRVFGERVNNSSSAQEAAQKIVELALRKGTDDNATALVVKNQSIDQTQPMTPQTKNHPTLEATEAFEQQIAAPAGYNAQLPSPKSIPDTVTLKRGSSKRKRSAKTRKRTNAAQRKTSRRRRRLPSTASMAVVFVAGICIGIIVSLLANGMSFTEQAESVQENAAYITQQSESTERLQNQEQDTDSPDEVPPDAVTASPQAVGQSDGLDDSSSDETLQNNQNGMTSNDAIDMGELQLALESDAELKYVDDNGMAWRFSHDQWFLLSTTLNLRSGSEVNVLEPAQKYKRERTYYTLSDNYLYALKNDVEQYRAGETHFQSELSDLCGEVEYLQFIEELCDSGNVEQIDLISHLLIDAQNDIQDSSLTNQNKKDSSDNEEGTSLDWQETVSV